MASKTDIANMALAHLGQSVFITDLDSDSSNAARVCRRFYDHARRLLLSGRCFRWASRIEDLSLVSDEDEDYNEEWAYAYQYPPNCLFFHRIVGDGRRGADETVIPFDQINDGDSRYILTDEEDAEGEYTYDVTATGLFPEKFVAALSYKLAAFIAPSLTGGDPNQLQQRVAFMEREAEQNAKACAMNENQAEQPGEGDLERFREAY